MKTFARAAVGLLLGSLGSDAAVADLTIFSQDQIMANMTVEKATAILLSSREVKQRPKLLAFLESTFGQGTSGRRQLRATKRHDQAPAAGGGLTPARNMLNEMMDDAAAKNDNEVERCGVYNRETLALLEQIRQDVASFNAAAAEARSRVLKSQGVIAFSNLKLPQVGEELDEHNVECAKEESSLQAEIAVVEADVAVMGSVLAMVGDCGAGAAAFLVQCRHCRKAAEGGYMMVQNSTLQPLLMKLKSAVARSYVQQSLGEAFIEVEKAGAPARHLTEKEAMLQVHMMQDPNDPEYLEAAGGDDEPLNISAVPEGTIPVDCVPTNKCTLGKGSCVKIRDRFLNIAAGIQDMLTKLKGELADLQSGCLDDKTIMEAQMANLGEKLRGGQTDLATATKDQVDSESSSNLKAQQHTEISGEYGTTMKECCDNQNDLKSEICALEKIRGELYKQKGIKIQISDCSVSEWKMSKCSVSCGGGVLEKTRGVLVHPNLGMACPPLVLQESCNTHPCPIDCQLGEWEGWSGCSADCGGGVRENMRPVLREMKYQGQPCEDTEESEGCKAQACNVNCELEEWSSWGTCTQACWKGSNRRDRIVKEPARGTGKCPAPTSESRLQFRDCNDKPCKAFYHKTPAGSFLKCGSKVDLLILLDGSGSLGETGWRQSKQMVENLISNLEGGDEKVKVALQVFSGPTNWPGYKSCIGAPGSPAPDMEKQCRISWVKRLTNNTMEVAKLVDDLKFPEATTLTSVALAEAETELINGREDAASVVLVISDGKPMSHERTVAAARQLQEKARIIFVPVGPDAPMELVEELASIPKHENIIHIDMLEKLSMPYFVDKIIAQTCPVLEPVVQVQEQEWEQEQEQEHEHEHEQEHEHEHEQEQEQAQGQ